jgi:hypothetical protein
VVQAKWDDKLKWQPDVWREPVDEALIQSVLGDATLADSKQRTKRLMEASNRDWLACYNALNQNKWQKRDNSYLSISKPDLERQKAEPVRCSTHFWFYRNRLIRLLGDAHDTDELPLLIKHKVLSHEKSIDKVRRDVEAFENFAKIDRASRERIPEKGRMFVWQRDGGQCVRCGSQERLEYDHIIALARGGSNTERNIQLLCESCNRTKGSNL